MSKLKGCCQKFQDGIFGNMEKFFNKFGHKVASYPFITILITLFISGLLMTGFIRWRSENDRTELWIPTNSDLYLNSKWLNEKFPSKSRIQQFMLVSENGQNVLTKENFKLLLTISQDISNLSYNGTKHSDICIKQAPCINSCIEFTVLYLYAVTSNCNYNKVEQIIDDFQTDAELINDLNQRLSTPIGKFIDVDAYLGELKKDSNGKIKSATAIKVTYMNNVSKEYPEEIHKMWEQEFLDYFQITVTEKLPEDSLELSIYPFATRSFGDLIGQTIGGDVQLLSMGFLVVFIFILIMLGKFNLVEQRFFLSLMGLACIGLGMGTSYGFSSLIGFPFTPMHSILPFLLLGIGIDDMFVIVQSFDNLKEHEKSQDLPSQFGIALKHAGVAITITSVTDLLAFGIGAFTILPAMQAFCVYAAIGIFLVFLAMITFFFACFSLDQRRIVNIRNICCCKHKDYQPNQCSQKSIMKNIFTKYASLLIQWPFKLVTFIITVILLILASYGISQLEAEFKFEWFLDEGTYLRNYFEINSERYDSGVSGTIWVAEKPDIHKKIKELDELIDGVSELQNSTLTENGVSSFLKVFIEYVKVDHPNYPASAKDMGKDEFYDNILYKFLCTNGSDFRGFIKLTQDFSCNGAQPNYGDPRPEILALTFNYNHRHYDSSIDMIGSINSVKDAINAKKDTLGPEGRVFAHSAQYSDFVTLEIITAELLRNILLAVICIFVVTLLLLSNIFASAMVVGSVILTLLDVAGFMYWWGLTIDTVSSLLLTVAMGLAVDYGAHIAHYFLTCEEETRNKRIELTLIEMGPAVFNGGFSTFLAFILLMTSKSYVFKTFFKIFFLVVSFGLFHGMVFLPVVLSLIGPKPYVNKEIDGDKVVPMESKPKSGGWTVGKANETK